MIHRRLADIDNQSTDSPDAAVEELSVCGRCLRVLTAMMVPTKLRSYSFQTRLQKRSEWKVETLLSSSTNKGRYRRDAESTYSVQRVQPATVKKVSLSSSEILHQSAFFENSSTSVTFYFWINTPHEWIPFVSQVRTSLIGESITPFRKSVTNYDIIERNKSEFIRETQHVLGSEKFRKSRCRETQHTATPWWAGFTHYVQYQYPYLVAGLLRRPWCFGNSPLPVLQ